MPDQHALVTASGSHRWLHCPPSARMEAELPDTTSEAAQEGTEAHALAEKKLLGWIRSGRRQRYKNDDEIMQEATDGYRDYVIGLVNGLKAAGEEADLYVEVRLDLSDWIPEGFGTSDACIVSTDTLHIADLKYGKGVKVEAENNSQMRLYALGAINIYWPIYEFSKVRMHIYQPRLDHIGSEEMTVAELLAWGETIKPIAKQAFDGTGEAKAGEWCRFCRCRAQCRARAEEMFQVIKEPKETLFMNMEEIASYLPYLDDAIKWAKELQDYALSQARAGEEIPGWKLVEGRSVRKVIAPTGLAQKMLSCGYSNEEIYKPQELKTITALEKLVGKKTFAAEYATYIEKPKGKPVLVPESDKRPVWVDQTAEDMFSEVEN